VNPPEEEGVAWTVRSSCVCLFGKLSPDHRGTNPLTSTHASACNGVGKRGKGRNRAMRRAMISLTGAYSAKDCPRRERLMPDRACRPAGRRLQEGGTHIQCSRTWENPSRLGPVPQRHAIVAFCLVQLQSIRFRADGATVLPPRWRARFWCLAPGERETDFQRFREPLLSSAN
jgi:hypothetical protein